MTNNIYLLYNYNNYFNRKVKREDTLSAYINAVGGEGHYLLCSNVVNFNPNDGIQTEHIFNFTIYDIDVTPPDYMLVVDESNNIQMRWFVIEQTRTRAGQYKLTLYRDTVAEAWNNIQDAPIFVEKAILEQTDDMIFNSENMTYNQIKKNETLLKDETECAWIVGYMTQDNFTTETQNFIPNTVSAETYATKDSYTYYSYTQNWANYDITDDWFYVDAVNLGLESAVRNRRVGINAHGNSAGSDGDGQTNLRVLYGSAEYAYANKFREQYATLHAKLKTEKSIISDALKASLDGEIGKVVYISTEQKFYRMEYVSDTSAISLTTVPYSQTGMYPVFKDAVLAANTVNYLDSFSETGVPGNNSLRYKGTIQKKKLKFVEVVSNQQITYKTSNSRRMLNDQPYSMFCMPYGTTTITGFQGTETKDWSEISMMVAKDISKKFSGQSAALYDLQLLPYCPIREFINHDGSGWLDLNYMRPDYDFNYITQNTINIGIIFWVTESKKKFRRSFPIVISNYKIDNETKFCRLCSPNYSGQFEFSPAKNGGVNGLDIEFTYKPYNPYIHINPIFKRLYGDNYGDARGLICGGKFDLPQTSDAWASYERSNSNYEAIFNRKIENLEVQNKYGKMSDVASAVAGTIQGAGTGAALGSAAGGAGAAAGAIIGGTISLGAGIADIGINDKLRKENMDLTKDMYGYELGTINAMPDSLVGVGAMTNNNKLYPFIEYYTSTDAEVEALKNKIKYNGMSVGRIGFIADFKDNRWESKCYFKGQLINTKLTEDWHFVNVLKSELNMGLFLEEV